MSRISSDRWRRMSSCRPSIGSSSNLKTWALGVYHGVRRKHLQAYLDEFAFRFNRRKSRHAAFATLIGIAIAIKPATYKMLVASGSTG